MNERLRTDVLVLGGGTAGVMAAIAAAEEGADVVLVERDSALGGVGVRAGIQNYYYGLTGGIQNRLDQSTRSLQKHWESKASGLLPEAKSAAIGRLIERLGIHVVYEATVAEMIMEGRTVKGAVVESERDAIRIEARVTVDATGDGDAADLAGASYTLGREWDGCQHAYSLIPRFVDENNVVRNINYDVGWLDVTDPVDVSRAYRVGRRVVWRAGATPETAHYFVAGPQLGVREGRRIVGDYVLRQDDLLLDRRFDDVVMRCFAHLENHAYDYANESDLAQIWIGVLGQWKFLFGGDVPYRCLIPLGIEGLLIGCRALSQDHDCGNLFRMQRDMQKLGEVSGVAAAMCVRTNALPRRLDVKALQRTLTARGVLRESDLTRESAPWLTFSGGTPEDRQRVVRNGASPEDIREIIRYLGTDEEPAALWWLWQFGEASAAPLLEAMRDAEGGRLRGIAFALGLLKREESVPYLASSFRNGEADKPNELDRTMERWQSALVLLRRMGSDCVFDDVLARIRCERKCTTLLLYLHYLIAVSGRLADARKAGARAAAQAVLADAELGDDYALHGSGVSIPAAADTRSIKWSLDATAAYLLEVAGGDGRGLLERYARDERGYVRTAAGILLERLKRAKRGG
ncbi:FAD-dependent oxidoreductase [Paenibacillus antri]|uniref:FAD-dependent oxidoreductase n=1 Tax=Paenibacillus antri TaxID=2582848 RepID=A0A5R9GF38_9BACL|nr:FAD-dependent oxidoreductase [Paenibacillus antri]TLS51844.1 FAD-dependent oxidoreductase [Paenibacillus antri]